MSSTDDVTPLQGDEKPKPLSRSEDSRKKNKNYLDFDDAREYMRSEMIPSRTKFYEWYELNKPKTIPRFPYRVYKEWVSWNDFLGNENEFSVKVAKNYRDYEKAVLWAQTLALKTQPEWLVFARSGELPADIPARPDLVYKQWRGWSHWLGKTTSDIIQAKQQEAARNPAVFYIVKEQNVPDNVFTFGVDPVGIPSLSDWWKAEQFQIIRLYHYEPRYMEYAKATIENLSSYYLATDTMIVAPNVWEIIWHLDTTLERVFVW